MKIKNIITVLFVFCTLNSFGQSQRNIHQTLPARQVHLDFHTSELIPGIGEKFNKKQWQEAIKSARLNQINIFAKCHHSWSYYPTKIGRIHPNLDFDLLGAQIEACHEIKVVCPIYFTVGWSSNEAEDHPEWCARNFDGTYQVSVQNKWDFNAAKTDVRPFTSWKELCPAAGGPYSEYVKSQVEEICKNYDADGFFFDIYHVYGCYCQYCMKRMRNENIDISNKEEVLKSNALAVKKHLSEMRAIVSRYHPEATVYFNGTPHVRNSPPFIYRLFDMNTEQQLEDLPTTWGGYDKLPLGSKYHLGQGVPVVAMSGKFHKAWGEFGGFKHSDAMKYEAAAMISYGASCNFGDQLHPSGEMDIETYRNIGKAFEYVEKIEQYGPGGLPVSKLGIWLTLDASADLGVVNMLLETHNDFIVANEKNLNQVKPQAVEQFAAIRRSSANSGWWVQDEYGNWVRK